MNETAIVLYSAQAEIAKVTPKNKNYLVECGTNKTVELRRNIDFGVIPKTKKPSLFKSGAEKICMGYGLLQQYELVDADKQFGKDGAFFRYLFKCNLVKVVDGREYVLSCGYGSANSSEKRCGFQSAFDADNGCVKMAQKRALTAAALAISGLSDAFTQDMENEEFMQNAKALIDTDKPDSPVNTNQIRRLYAIGGEAGMTANEVKQKLAAMGYTSTKQILQKDYNAICDALKGETNAGNVQD
jgi:hypothetical protein